MKSNRLHSTVGSVGIRTKAAGAHNNIGFSLAASPALFSDGLSEISRSARCYLLMQGGSIDLPLAPRMPEVITIDSRHPLEAVADNAFQECLDQIATNLVVVERLDDTEGAHQLRNGVKRLRIAFSAFAPALNSIDMARLDGEARWLDRQIGKLRDLDVAANIVLRQMVLIPGEPSLLDLSRLLLQMVSKCRRNLRTMLARDRARGFLIDLAGFVDSLSKEDSPITPANIGSIKDIAGGAISFRWEALDARSRKLDEHDAGQRHKLRKRIRNLRYAVQLFQSLFRPDHVEPFLRRLKDMQTALGGISDAEMMKRIFHGIEGSAGNRAMERAIAQVDGMNAAKVAGSWTKAQTIWPDLIDMKPFWDSHPTPQSAR